MSEVAINWFEIPSKDVGAAKSFYEQVLGVSLGQIPGPDGDMMEVFMGAEGPSGALLPAAGDEQPGTAGTRLYLNCADIDGALSRVAAAGGKVVREKFALGPYGFSGTLKDLDGNLVALHTGAG